MAAREHMDRDRPDTECSDEQIGARIETDACEVKARVVTALAV